MFEDHLGEVGVELLGQDHGHGRVNALAHLDLRHDQGRLAVAGDADEGVGSELAGGLVRPLLRLVDSVWQVASGADGQVEAQQQAAGQSGLQQPTARGGRAHAMASPAARLIAARMRT